MRQMQGLSCAPSSMRDKAKLSVEPEDPASGFSTRKQKADVAFSNLLHIFSISSGKIIYSPIKFPDSVGICLTQSLPLQNYSILFL